MKQAGNPEKVQLVFLHLEKRRRSGQQHTWAPQARGRRPSPRESPSGFRALSWPQKHLTFGNVPLELFTQVTAVPSTRFSGSHALCHNSCASLRCGGASHGGTPVTPRAPGAQASGSGAGSEFWLQTLLGTKTVAIIYFSSTLHFGHLFWKMRKSDRVLYE